MEDELKIFKVEYLRKKWIESFSNLISTLDDQTIMYKSFEWRRPPMEDGLKILKVEYLSNRLLDHTQISNFSLDDQIIFLKPPNEDGRWPPMEDDLKKLKVEHLSNHCMECDLWVLRGKLEEN